MSKSIIVASFGTTYTDGYEKSIGTLAEKIRDLYPDYTVLESFSSEVVRKRLKDKGVDTLNYTEALKQLEEDGVEEVYTLMMFILDGVEYEKVIAQGEEFPNIKQKYTKAMLQDEEEYKRVAAALEDTFDKPAVLVGHGSYHSADGHYHKLQQMLWDQGKDIYLGTMEGDIGQEDVLDHLKENKEEKDVILTPFLLMAGLHADEDIADTEEPESWYNVLKENGYNPEVQVVGLCERDSINKIFLENLNEILCD